jgi:hypothetical protein
MERQLKAIMVLLTIAMFMMVTAFLPAHLNAGSLEPTGPPGPTMKTLDEIPPTWSLKITDSAARFELVLDGAAVLDKETGLVWEQSPDMTNRVWTSACEHCYTREVGGRKGWRLPTIEELASLLDTTNFRPALPTGHPFNIVGPADYYWSSTSYAESSYPTAWYVSLEGGGVDLIEKDCLAPRRILGWCVRGGHGHDAY